MKKHKIGGVTIGQSPRVDITADIAPLLDPSIELVEAGAMDAYTFEEIQERFAPEEGHTVLVSRMRDGRQCVLSEEKILPEVERTITQLMNEGCELILLLCTGQFPPISCEIPLITPYALLHGVVGGIYQKGSVIGVVAPHPDQLKDTAGYWLDEGYQAYSVALSPYLNGDVQEAVQALAEQKPQVILLDCLGYTIEMKKAVQRAFGGAVLLPRTLMAQMLNQMFA